MIRKAIVILLLVVSAHSVCQIDTVDFDDFEPLKFLQSCGWFDLKNLFYATKNNSPRDDVKFGKVKAALTDLGTVRQKIIFDSIQHIFGDDCEWKQTLSDRAESVKRKFKDFFGGHTFFLECKKYMYFLNSFGSSTVTSDFDYSVLMVSLTSIYSSIPIELAQIKEVTSKLYLTGQHISSTYCGGQPSDECLDTNGYPDIMVLYLRYYRYQSLSHKIEKKQQRYTNLFSSKILRHCLVAQVYMKLLDNLDLIDIKNDQMISQCYNMIFRGIEKFRTKFKLPKQYSDKERVVDPYPVADPEHPTQKEIRLNSFLYNVLNYNRYIGHIKTAIEYFSTNKSFEDCISHIDRPKFFIRKMGIKKKNVRVVRFGKQLYEVVDDLFYLPNSYDPRLIFKTNKIHLPFLGACHIWASEAYITFGALEYVKFEKRIESGEVHVKCDTLIESFTENFGMMLYHLAEYIKNDVFEDYLVDHNQVISDTYSKYLRRALKALDFQCKNDYELLVPTFYHKNSNLDDILVNEVYQFYLAIKDVNQSDPDKKDLYFEQFLKFFSGMQLLDLIRNTVQFYQKLYLYLTAHYNIEGLFLYDHIEKSNFII